MLPFRTRTRHRGVSASGCTTAGRLYLQVAHKTGHNTVVVDQGHFAHHLCPVFVFQFDEKLLLLQCQYGFVHSLS